MALEQRQIGKYVLGRKLGSGGFGDVFAARDASLDREVALKVLRPDCTSSAEIVKRFLLEARSAARIVHPGIVTVHECAMVANGTATDGVGYIAMELLAGETLAARLARSGRLAAGDVVELGRQLASALEAAHRLGIVHRDLKPENIFLVPDPAVPIGERTKVLDFGIAKLVGSPTEGMQTQASMVFGTPRYMSPEQCRSAAEVDHRSDIYSLGCILFELSCGRPPFDGTSNELISQHLLVAAPPLAPDVPPDLASLIASMLAKHVDHRPHSMAHVQQALARIAGSRKLDNARSFTEPDAGSRNARVVTTVLPRDTVRDAATPTTLSALAGASTTSPKATNRLALAGALIAVGVVASIAGYVARSDGTVAIEASLARSDRATTLAVDDNSTRAKTLARTEDSASPTLAHEAPATITEVPGIERGDRSARTAVLASDTRDRSSRPAIANEAGDRGARPKVFGAKPASRARAVVSAPTPAERTSPSPAPERTAPERPAPVDARPPPKLVEPAPAPGLLTIRATYACDVLVDGHRAGRTPLIAHALTPGPHRIALVDGDRVRDNFVVRIRSGAAETLFRELPSRAPAAPPRDATINPFEAGGTP